MRFARPAAPMLLLCSKADGLVDWIDEVEALQHCDQLVDRSAGLRQLKRLGQYPQQARLRATPVATRDAQQGQQGVDTQTALGRFAENM